MKKMIAMLLVVAFVTANLVGCGGGSTTGTTKTPTGGATGQAKDKDTGKGGGK